MKKQIIILSCVTIILLSTASIVSQNVFAEIENQSTVVSETNIEKPFEIAKQHFKNAEYRQAIEIYDTILDKDPNNTSSLKMKGLAHNAIGEYSKSLKQFFKIFQENPNDVTTLTAMGIGFGNLGEYKEALNYLEKAKEHKPNDIVIKNYIEFLEKTIKKFPNHPATEKPIDYKNEKNRKIPQWVKEIVNWWAHDKIDDNQFLSSLEYMIEKNIIKIDENSSFTNKNELKMLSAIRNDLNLWSEDESTDDEFFKVTNWFIENKLIKLENSKKTQEQLDHEYYLFNKYLRDISYDINKQIRYIEYANPSEEVIKKYIRDYNKWNFEQQSKISSEHFPDPTYEVVDETYVITYKVFINPQPAGLPLDHVGTLTKSFEFWGKQELQVQYEKGVVQFEITNLKHEANVWVTWVVRSLGEGVLGHAHLGKGIVEVSLGDYSCDGKFQLYSIDSVQTIMTHELGHTIGLPHTGDKQNIMYPSLTPTYAYCLSN